MTKVIGWDIGGANTKVAYLRAKDGFVEEIKTAKAYFPVWKTPKELGVTLSELARKVAGPSEIDCVAVTMTAELSDAYRTKREGVNQILNHVQDTFPTVPIFVLNVDIALESIDAALKKPLRVAAANWAATGWLVSQFMPDCIVIDVGSTTTSIIPVVDGVVAAAGKTDLDKLINGELVYTGGLRTNVAAIVNRVPLAAGLARVSSELFAQSADVHMVLGNISEEDYTVETADGRGKTKPESLARLARVVCADTEMLSKQEIVQMAKHIYEQQIEQISKGFSQVYDRVRKASKAEFPAVVTGIGRNFLATKAAQRVGITNVVDLNRLINSDVASVSTAVTVAAMALSKLEGRTVKWMH